ncbi:MAG: hypothetical protein ACMXX7_01845 [Candidatus Woesearchaeota archaeon]
MSYLERIKSYIRDFNIVNTYSNKTSISQDKPISSLTNRDGVISFAARGIDDPNNFFEVVQTEKEFDLIDKNYFSGTVVRNIDEGTIIIPVLGTFSDKYIEAFGTTLRAKSNFINRTNSPMLTPVSLEESVDKDYSLIMDKSKEGIWRINEVNVVDGVENIIFYEAKSQYY